MLDYAQARRNMVDCQLRTADVTDRAILAAMGEVPRERFVPAERVDLAYSDHAVALGDDMPGDGCRYLLAPMVLARLIQALELRADTRLLDVGCGFGYSSAVAARLAGSVVALETSDDLGSEARARLDESGVGDRVEIRTGHLDAGCPEAAPFDAILVNGSVESRPDTLLGQLVDGGRLACLMSNGRSGQAVALRSLGRGNRLPSIVRRDLSRAAGFPGRSGLRLLSGVAFLWHTGRMSPLRPSIRFARSGGWAKVGSVLKGADERFAGSKMARQSDHVWRARRYFRMFGVGGGLRLSSAIVAASVLASPSLAWAETLDSALARAYAGNPTLDAQRASVRAVDENVPRALAGYRADRHRRRKRPD